MVDLLGREGFLKEAETLLRTIPLWPDMEGWACLLSHCRTYGNVDIGRRCFDHVTTLDDQYTTGYMLMSSIYASADMWEDADKIQQMRICANAQKKPGEAFIEVHNSVHGFCVGDKSHPESHNIYTKLKRLNIKMMDKGDAGFQLPIAARIRCG